MDSRETYEAMRAAFTDALAEHKPEPPMIPIDPFDAEDEGGDPVRVVGITTDDDMLKFVVIEEDADGAIYPIVRTSIYRKGASLTGPTSRAA